MSMAVGLIVHADQAEQILQDGRADLIALARELLYNPNWPMDAAQKLGVDAPFRNVPPPIRLLARHPRQARFWNPAFHLAERAAGGRLAS